MDPGQYGSARRYSLMRLNAQIKMNSTFRICNEKILIICFYYLSQMASLGQSRI